MNPCREVYERVEEGARIAVVHHLGSDVMASAAIIERAYADRKALHFLVPLTGLSKASRRAPPKSFRLRRRAA